MRLIGIPASAVQRAKAKADEMGLLNNSITSGHGSVAGFVGEEVARFVMGGTERNTLDYDLILDDGSRVEVKTKRTKAKPQPHYDCSVAAYNTRQDCDLYAFVRVHSDLKIAWFLGVYPKDAYYRDARFLREGEVDQANNFTVKADCYNLSIDKLYTFSACCQRRDARHKI